ncbi:MAG: MurT ligase domain-containing protein [Oscillospiraceae bacterium]|jgi:UDP-N-acetylmuramyl tripeptide synthase|nr:MurT ligase domain-containing protein [Oscillospiraceae bacterium]
MTGKIQFIIALFAGKCARLALRIFGHNASYLPGAVALKICPDFLGRVAKPEKIICVTGTNGKTTVSNLLEDCLRSLGKPVLSNRLGSNTAAGIAAALMRGVTARGRSKFPVAVLETDERFAPLIMPRVSPSLVVVTNLFRDSIMRNAHPEFIFDFLERGIPDGTPLLLNGDDPISSRLKPENPRKYFGIEKMPGDVSACPNLICDMRVCPECRAELEYDYRRYHHIGRCRCTKCGWSSPEYDYAGFDADFDALTITFSARGGADKYRLLSDSVFNAYNLVCAAGALSELGFDRADVTRALGQAKITQSRYNAVKSGKSDIIMQMSKDRNALASSRAFDYVSSRGGTKEIILMMNNLSDNRRWSENTCWLYDCDFEFLNRDEITRIVATGPRAPDYFLRLLLAGVPENRLRCVAEETDAPDALEYPPGGSVYILYGTDAIDLAYKVRGRAAAAAAGKAGAV